MRRGDAPVAGEPQELRALAESAYAALNARDLDRFSALLADHVEFTSLIAEAEGVSFRGREGIRTWWETVVASFDDVRWKILDMTTGPVRHGCRPSAHRRVDWRRSRRANDVAGDPHA